MIEQIKQNVHIVSLFPPVDTQILAAEKLSLVTPPGLNRVFWTLSGSDANETALKIARQYWKIKGQGTKYKVISRWESYHGSCLGSMSATGYRFRRIAFEPLMPGFIHMNPPYCYRCGYEKTYPECNVYCARELRRLIEYEGPSTIACWIGDMTIGGAGGINPPIEYPKIIREICDEYDILMIDDEVINGFARTGEWFDCQNYGITPDIITCGKGISGGYAPVAAAVVKDDIADEFTGEDVFQHGFTYAGLPISLSAVMACIDMMVELDMPSVVKKKSQYLMSKLREVERDSKIIGDLHGSGLSIGIDLVKNKETKEPIANPREVATFIYRLGLEHGYKLGVWPGSWIGESVMMSFLPPLIATKEELKSLSEAIAGFVKATEEKFGPD